MRLFAIASLAFVLNACSGGSSKPPEHETVACMSYRAMMVAPMSPDAMQRLQQKCAASHDK